MPFAICHLVLISVMSDEMGVFTLSQRRRLRRILLAFGAFVLIGLGLRASYRSPHDNTPIIKDISPTPPTKVFVVASMEKDDMAWIHEYLPDWKLIRYVVDNPMAEYTVPKNKGREAMVYLTSVLHAKNTYHVI
jgi:hypothetical protein